MGTTISAAGPETAPTMPEIAARPDIPPFLFYVKCIFFRRTEKTHKVCMGPTFSRSASSSTILTMSFFASSPARYCREQKTVNQYHPNENENVIKTDASRIIKVPDIDNVSV
jgi:hypothetical protein